MPKQRNESSAAHIPGEWRCHCPGEHGRIRPEARGCPRCGCHRPASGQDRSAATPPRVRLRFAWYDLWVGAYIDRAKRILYICPIPALLIEVRFKEIDAPPGWLRLLAFWLYEAVRRAT